MTKKRGAVPCPRDPIGLSLEEASTYVGMSPPSFDRLMREGTMPCPRQFKNRLIWDADEVAAAFRAVPHKKVDLNAGVRPMHDDGPSDEDEWKCRV